MIDNFDDIEDAIAELPQVEHKLTHHFADGLYGREMFVKKDVILTGRVHKKAHLNFLMSGTIVGSDGKESAYLLEGPCVFRSEAGVRRIGITVTDCVWVTVASCESDNIEDAVDELTEPPRQSVLDTIENNKLENK